MTLPLQNSYVTCDEYPLNIIPGEVAIHTDALRSYRKRLEYSEADLCLVGEDEIRDDFEVPVIDSSTADGSSKDSCTIDGLIWNLTAAAVDKRYIHTASKLRNWLGVENTASSDSGTLQDVRFTKRDPKCRFIYIYGEHAGDKLKITRASLAEVLTYHQVMPAYLDFILVFSGLDYEKDPSFFGFREQTRLKAFPSAYSVPDLGRSQKSFRLCFNLRGVALGYESTTATVLNQWSIQNASIYHHFDLEYGTTLWIVTKGGMDLLDRYSKTTSPKVRRGDHAYTDLVSCFRTSLSVHIMFSQWSTEDWRWYVSWLEEILYQETELSFTMGRQYIGRFSFGEVQFLRDSAIRAVMFLESNMEILDSLGKFYKGLFTRTDFPDSLKKDCEDDLRTFCSQLDEIVKDFQRQLGRVRLVVSIVNDRREQFIQAQTEELNRRTGREAVVMRIITTVTLVYLPATFVSTFFSIDIIKFKNPISDNAGDNSETFSALAMERWLQVTFPLTALTLLGSWLGIRFHERPSDFAGVTARLQSGFAWIKHFISRPDADDWDSHTSPSSSGFTARLATIWQSVRAHMPSSWSKSAVVENHSSSSV